MKTVFTKLKYGKAHERQNRPLSQVTKYQAFRPPVQNAGEKSNSSQKTWALEKGCYASARYCDPSFSKPYTAIAAELRLGNSSSSCPQSRLAPSDFHLFGPLKRHLGGMAFETEDDLISELRNWFDNLDVDFFRVGINSLLPRWQKCIDLHGDYVEK
ncbi:histone-lysine N-methyltransferase SETMAR [Plakobranchus ocellatus]|uniref:Histone-lysine N-methyltransferase SETMAR n=1 Tax=Plakobranchus ocellatus TaxID=259542 RepID=A0AAV4C958_9GAST|nr:histone-lysine N-methyltransferase SETMAR [Plakobranchus ocellatus]